MGLLYYKTRCDSNDYEVEVGTFKSEINLHTETFKQFSAWIEQNQELFNGKKIAMFCTGGIRCERSTSLLKARGYKDVYHLKSGILLYLEDTQNKNNLWQGECFVFDDRRAVADDLSHAEGYWLERERCSSTYDKGYLYKFFIILEIL